VHEPGELLAQGRAADVYACGDGLILRRYRSDHFSLYEAAVMQHVAAHGYPVPKVVEASGRDIVMERVEGPTMLADLAAHPWRLFSHANTLASLADRLHAIPRPPWLDPRVGGGDTLVHMDLHPDNVMITEHGPVVIDWSNAGAGPAEAEIADLWLLMSVANVPGSGIVPKLLSYGRKLFLRTFMKHFDRDELRKHVRAAGEWRLRDRNMHDDERERIRRFVEKWATQI
jgi:aminoglycoside phosphotransferase (APT) family kinase protein